MTSNILHIEVKTIDDLNTGDIILCHSSGPGGADDTGLDGAIEFVTHSPWEHCGIIIRDPWWLQETGLFIFQSGGGPNLYPDVLNGKISGVTLNRFGYFLQNREFIFARSLENFEFNQQSQDMFVQAFNTAHGKPYDRNWCSWAGTGCDSFFNCHRCSKKSTPATISTFWCSALVAYMYVEMGLMDGDLDWSSQTPEDIAKAHLVEPFRLGKIWQIQ